MKDERKAQITEMLKRAGVDPAKALGAPPTIDSVKSAPAAVVKWVGPLDKDHEYYRASSANEVELAQMINTEGYVVCPDEVRLAGCSTANDVVLMRRRDTAQQIERDHEVRRENARQGVFTGRGVDEPSAVTTQKRSQSRRVDIHEKAAA